MFDQKRTKISDVLTYKQTNKQTNKEWYKDNHVTVLTLFIDVSIKLELLQFVSYSYVWYKRQLIFSNIIY